MLSYRNRLIKIGLPLAVLAAVLLAWLVTAELGERDAQTGQAGVASAHPLATEAGINILKNGGNAFDAAVAVSAALAVVEPSGSGLGGGGFWLLYDAASGTELMIDGREKAPLAATRDMYLDASGEVIPKLSIDGALAAGIPGAPAALAYLSQNHGALPLATVLAPAIQLAEDGFVVDSGYRRRIKFRLQAVQASAEAAQIFLDDGEVPAENTVIKQPDLANTLRALARAGHDGFYRGMVAQKLVDGVRDVGGIWTMQDLREYAIKVREPVTAHYKGMKITSAALPSSGGLVLAQTLNILSAYKLDELSETDFTHVTVEAMRRAYRDRALYMGDEDFFAVPKKRLLDLKYADAQRKSIRLTRATASETISRGELKTEGADTTHFSVIDSAGNRVAATLSINYPFGSGLVPPGTGVLLNDEMDDFSAKPGVPNVYGLVGGDANAITGGKRMLSSMSPTFLQHNGRTAALGTPGGSRIISMVLLAALAFYDGASAQAMVDRPRFHHQYLPDAIQFEPGALPENTIAELRARGHQLDAKTRTWGNMHIVMRDADGNLTAASDSRGVGAGVVTGNE